MGEPLGTVKIQNIKNGTVTDNTCRININPCINGGTCQVTWNDFNCLCTPQYDGKVCDTRLRCADVVCPEGSVCHNIGWTGFECVAEAAFDGKDKESPHYILSSTEKDNITFNEASFRYGNM
jgi:protein crumbs